ncbi:unnamed protein product [Malus baccata var. baccata]
MANKSWVVVSLVLCVAVAVVSSSDPGAPLIFVLGDSTADVGTNNFLPTSTARANFPHNGIDFPSSKPTGRFSNGLNSADFLAQILGLRRSPPPFLSLKAKSLRKKRFSGVNFASGGSGLLDITGKTSLSLMKFGTPEKTPLAAPSVNQKNVVSLTEQIQQFATKSLFFISIGSNDLFEYYHSNSSIPKEEFLTSLLLAYENHLKNLIDLGARKFGIISVAPIGCCPSQRIHNTTSGCLEDLNDLAVAFHARLDALMFKMSSVISHFVHFLMAHFTQVEAACCGAGKLNGESFCSSYANLCLNRDNYLFWDLYHPTQAASKLAAVTLFNGGPQFVLLVQQTQVRHLSSYLVTQLLMLEQTISCSPARLGLTFPTMALTFLPQNPLGGSAMASTVLIFFLALMKYGTPKKTQFAASSVSQKNVVPLAEQIQQFSTVKSNLTAIKGGRRVTERSLFFISIGSNDLFGYYHSNSSIPKKEFLSSLLLAYENHLKGLIDLGARKFGIISIAPIGCCPSQRVYNASGGCLEDLNDLAVAFHSRLDALMSKLSSEYKDVKYALGNAFEMTINVIRNPLPFNFTQVEAACCGAGKLNGESFCSPNATLCLNRDNYLFWDLFHPTQAASKLAAVTLFNGGPQFVTPINFAQLAMA